MLKETDEIYRLWKTIFSWKMVTGIVVCVVLIYLATMPWLIKPMYESEAIVYVPLTIPNQQISQQGVGFAGEHEIDSYIQMLKSNILADSLIKRFGLNHDNLHNHRSLYKTLESNIKVEKTRYGSVSIKVQDHDPAKAAAMANCIIGLGESIKRDLLYPNREEAMLYSKSLYEQKSLEVAGLEKAIEALEPKDRKQGSFDYDKAQMAYKLEFQELIARKEQYERARKDFDAPLPKVYVVSPALEEDKPVWPKRGLLCLLGAAAYLTLIVIIETIKRDIHQKTL